MTHCQSDPVIQEYKLGPLVIPQYHVNYHQFALNKLVQLCEEFSILFSKHSLSAYSGTAPRIEKHLNLKKLAIQQTPKFVPNPWITEHKFNHEDTFSL